MGTPSAGRYIVTGTFYGVSIWSPGAVYIWQARLWLDRSQRRFFDGIGSNLLFLTVRERQRFRVDDDYERCARENRSA
jgi:hypothetical protein